MKVNEMMNEMMVRFNKTPTKLDHLPQGDGSLRESSKVLYRIR